MAWVYVHENDKFVLFLEMLAVHMHLSCVEIGRSHVFV